MALSLAVVQDLNNPNSQESILVCLKIELAGQDPVYLVRNNANVTFNGTEYIAFNFDFSELTSGKGEVPSFTLNLDNISRAVTNMMIQYDIYLKQNGIDGNKVYATIFCINTIDGSLASEEWKFELTSWDITTSTASFKLGASSPFTKEYPPRKMYANFCGFKFKSARCGYTGTETTCDKTLTRCRQLNNSVRFGGFKGMNA